MIYRICRDKHSTQTHTGTSKAAQEISPEDSGLHTINSRILLCAFLIALFSYFIFTISARIYVYTDNITVAVVTDGLYGDNNFCQYLHPLLCVIIKVLTPLIPTADMFTVFCHIFIFIEILALSYVALSITVRKPKADWAIENYIAVIVSVVAMIFFSTVINLWNVNYSVQAASFVFSGMILLFFSRSTSRFDISAEENKGDRLKNLSRTGHIFIILGTIFVAVGFMLRYEAALLFLPYIALEILADIVRHRKGGWRHVVPMVTVIIALMGSRFIFYSIEPYATAQRYNQYRTSAEDYPMKIYGAYTGDFSDIEKTEYNAATTWVLADTEAITADKLENFVAVGSTKVGYVNARALLLDMWKRLTQTDIQLLLLFCFTVMLLIRNLACLQDKCLKMETILSVLGSFIILAYITWLGRALLRIWQSVLLANLAIMLICAFKDATETRLHIKQIYCFKKSEYKQAGSTQIVPNIGNTLFLLLIGVIMWFGIGQYMARSEMHMPYTALTARTGADDSVYEETYSGTANGTTEAIYIWPNWYAAIPDYFSKIDKLPTKRVIQHNVPIGDWTYEQPYFIEFLESVDARNPMKALLERPNTYMMEGYEDLVLEFMHLHYGEDIVLREVGEVNEWKSYILEHGGSKDVDEKINTGGADGKDIAERNR